MNNTGVMPSLKKYIMKRSLHLGNIKESFSAGTIIEKNEFNNTLVIDGRNFQSTKDLDILLRHEWAVPYSAEIAAEILKGKALPIIKDRSFEKTDKKKMEVVQCDSDTHEEIDISSTKTPKKPVIAKDKNRKLEIIAGDEPVEDNLKRVNKPLPIIEDDGSLGVAVSKSPALNAGMVKVPQIDAAKVEAQKAARKAALETARATRRATEESIQTLEQAVNDDASGDTNSAITSSEPKQVEKSSVKVVISEEAIEMLETAATPIQKARRGRPKGALNKNKVEASATIPSALEFSV